MKINFISIVAFLLLVVIITGCLTLAQKKMVLATKYGEPLISLTCQDGDVCITPDGKNTNIFYIPIQNSQLGPNTRLKVTGIIEGRDNTFYKGCVIVQVTMNNTTKRVEDAIKSVKALVALPFAKCWDYTDREFIAQYPELFEQLLTDNNEGP